MSIKAKFGITIDLEVLKKVEKKAKTKQWSRSKVINETLKNALK